MFVIKNPDKLPLRLPPDVRFACFLANLVEGTAHDTCPWGTSKAHLLRMVQEPGKDKPSVGITPMDWGFNGEVADAIEQLKMLGRDRQLLDGPRGQHLGLILVCEMWRLRQDTEQELAELIEGASPPPPQQYELRMALGALTNGWHLALARPRDGERVLRVARPQDVISREHFPTAGIEQLHRLNNDFVLLTR